MTTKKMDKKILEVFKALDKLNPEATFLSETSLSTVDDWLDTGCMVLNSIISGSLYKGIPKGRITGLAGPSMCGKTYIINKILGNAQKRGYIPVVFDTEMAVDEGNALAVGLDPKNTKYVPVNTIEDCRNQLMALLDGIEKPIPIEPLLPNIAVLIPITSPFISNNGPPEFPEFIDASV